MSEETMDPVAIMEALANVEAARLALLDITRRETELRRAALHFRRIGAHGSLQTLRHAYKAGMLERLRIINEAPGAVADLGARA